MSMRNVGPIGAASVVLTPSLTLGLSPLNFSPDPALQVEVDAWRIEEGFRRGGNWLEIQLRIMHEHDLPVVAAEAARSYHLNGPSLRTSDIELESGKLLAEMVSSAENYYRAQVLDEFNNLPRDVQAAFGAKGVTPFENYLRIRPAYYNAGYDDPADSIFSQLRQVRLVGHLVVSPGIHDKLADVLPKVDQILNQMQPGLALSMGKLIHSVGGFVPRFIAHRQGQKRPSPLSNHALGLAIDIDPSNNPHIKDHDVIVILNKIASATGIDYGKAIVQPAANVSAEDWAGQVHSKAQAASDLIKTWLQKYLPVYDEVVSRQALEQKLAKSKTPAEMDALLAQLSGGGVPATPKLSDDEVEAVEKIKVLRKFHSADDLKTWSKHGIQTIPMLLAVALVKAGLRWGQTYSDTKDAMHFELVVKGKAVVTPDSAPRTFDELFPQSASVAPVAKGKKKKK